MIEIKVRWPLIVTEWDKIYFNRIDLGNYTMYRMCIFKTFSPRPGLFVAIEDRGAFFFSLENELHRDYVASKLHVEGDRAQVADFLNAQLKKDNRQQGHYYKEVIDQVEIYGNIGEDKFMPWHPEIIVGE